MSTEQTIQNADIKGTFAPHVVLAPADITIISHSNVFYWWPAWVMGFVAAAFSYLQGRDVAVVPEVVERVHPSNNPGILFISIVVLLAWLGWWDDILRFVPHLSARANVGFYLLFSNALLGVWLLAFFGFDRLTVWRVRPGQMIEERMVGGEARSYDTNGLVFEKRGQDLFHDVFLGLGAGDLTLTTGGAIKETIHIPNVLLVNRKMKAIEKLIAVKPDHQA